MPAVHRGAEPGAFAAAATRALPRDIAAFTGRQADYQTAATSLNRALAMYREVGDRGSQAETLNHLGALQATTLGPDQGLARYTEALTIARDIGMPLEEADALAGIGRCRIQAGDTAAGAAFLRQALDVYQQLGSPSAHNLQELLNQHRT